MSKTIGDVIGFVDGFEGKGDQEIIEDYSTRLVAFVDILGMRNFIKKEKQSVDVINTMNKFAQIVKRFCYGTSFKFIIMGDGVAIIADTTDFERLCMSLTSIQVEVMKELRMPIRGALTSGDVTVLDDGKIIVGPAFVEAFELESEVAIYPRIIISCKAMEIYHDGKQEFTHIRRDFDQNYILDFVSAIKVNETYSELVISELQEIVNERICDQSVMKSCKLIQKYGWLNSILNN